MTTEEKQQLLVECRMQAATAWQNPRTSSKVMDPELAESFAAILAAHIEAETDLNDKKKSAGEIQNPSKSGSFGFLEEEERNRITRMFH